MDHAAVVYVGEGDVPAAASGGEDGVEREEAEEEERESELVLHVWNEQLEVPEARKWDILCFPSLKESPRMKLNHTGRSGHIYSPCA